MLVPGQYVSQTGSKSASQFGARLVRLQTAAMLSGFNPYNPKAQQKRVANHSTTACFCLL